MNKLKSVGLAVALCLVSLTQARAGVTLTLSSTTPDLLHLHIGDTVEVDVTLSGLVPNDTLDFLAADVKFDGTLFGTPTSVVAGPIVPDLTGFSHGASSGLGNGNYDDLFANSGTPITSNGVFFFFIVKAQAAGSGTVAFGNLTNGAFLNGGFVDPTAANTLPFTIVSNTAVVPEPSTLLLGAIGVGLAWTVRRTRSAA